MLYDQLAAMDAICKRSSRVQLCSPGKRIVLHQPEGEDELRFYAVLDDIEGFGQGHC